MARASSVDGSWPPEVASVLIMSTRVAFSDGRYTVTVSYPGREPLCPIHPLASKMPSPYVVPGKPVGSVLRRWAWVLGLSSVPVATILAQRRRSCRFEIIAPAAQAQLGFQ